MAGLFFPHGKGPFKKKSWDAIDKEFNNLVGQGWDQQPMLDLVRHIQKNKLSEKLFATTFDATMIITLFEKIDPFNVALHIVYDSVDKAWRFTYFGTNKGGWFFMDPKPQFDRVYEDANGTEIFDEFITRMRWYKIEK